MEAEFTYSPHFKGPYCGRNMAHQFPRFYNNCLKQTCVFFMVWNVSIISTGVGFTSYLQQCPAGPGEQPPRPTVGLKNRRWLWSTRCSLHTQKHTMVSLNMPNVQPFFSEMCNYVHHGYDLMMQKILVSLSKLLFCIYWRVSQWSSK